MPQFEAQALSGSSDDYDHLLDLVGDSRVVLLRDRFPTWMWRNAEVLDFVGWLRAHNEHAAGKDAGFYSLDLTRRRCRDSWACAASA